VCVCVCIGIRTDVESEKSNHAGRYRGNCAPGGFLAEESNHPSGFCWLNDRLHEL